MKVWALRMRLSHIVEKLVSRWQGRQEMVTVSFVTSIIKTPENEEHDEAMLGRWRSTPTVSHQVSEPMDWPTPAAVNVVSVVDHTRGFNVEQL